MCRLSWISLTILNIWCLRRSSGDKSTEITTRFIKTYRNLKIIEILATITNSWRLIPVFVVGFPAIQFFSSYVCIRLRDEISWPEFLMFPLVYWDGFLINMILFTAASNTYEGSSRLLRKWKWSQKHSPYTRKVLASLTPLKFKFGDNFVERTTPLVIQDFSIQNTVTGLLLKN